MDNTINFIGDVYEYKNGVVYRKRCCGKPIHRYNELIFNEFKDKGIDIPHWKEVMGIAFSSVDDPFYFSSIPNDAEIVDSQLITSKLVKCLVCIDFFKNKKKVKVYSYNDILYICEDE